MLIEASDLSLSGQYQLERHHQVTETLTTKTSAIHSNDSLQNVDADNETRAETGSPELQLRLDELLRRLNSAGVNNENNLSVPSGNISEPDMEGLDAKTWSLKSLVESLTGKSLDLAVVKQYWQKKAEQIQSELLSVTDAAMTQSVLRLERFESLYEKEHSTFTASGIVNTKDGREISFSLSSSMTREYQWSGYLRADLKMQQLIDPLVISLDGKTPSLSASTTAFDLNSDGTKEHIHFTSDGSAFLAYDRNQNGTIDNGNELFGPMTGNSYAELARYDEDGNEFIDSGDSAYQHLSLWQKDARGHDTLQSLSDAGIGALYLGTAYTPFEIRDSDNQLKGKVRQSSVYIKENGDVGITHQIDLAV